MGALLGALLIALLLGALHTQPLHAQDAVPLQPAELAAAREQISNDEINVIARELWCPLCSGVRLDACELKACDQMKDVIAIKLADGEELPEIRDYFVEYYGPQVLGEPPLEGINWLAWVLPIVVLVGGGVYLILRMRSSRGGAPAAADGPTTAAAEDSEYSRKLDEELRKYE